MTSTRTQQLRRLAVPLAVLLAIGAAVLLALLTGTNNTDPQPSPGAVQTPTITGTALPADTGTGTDPAVGSALPSISGTDYAGRPVAFTTRAQVIVVAAHWCPHCNRELPKIMAWRKAGSLPDVTYNLVSTAVREGAKNYPPSTWLDETMGWQGAVLADDGSVAEALGVSGFPFFIVVDDQGKVTARLSGEQELTALLAAMATAGLTHP